MAGPSLQLEDQSAPPLPPKQRVPEIVEAFASHGSYRAAGAALGMHHESVRDIIKSPQGAFALEQLLRERARSRALRLGALTDRTIDEYEAILDRGEERVLTGRRDDDPLTIWCRPSLRDVVNGLAWATHHMRDLADTLSSIDVTNHDVSHEARSLNLASLKELVAQEERRLLLDGERAASPDAPAVDAPANTPWSRSRWGGLDSTPKRLSSASDADTVAQSPGSSSSAADAVAALTRDSSSSAPDTAAPSRTRPPTPPTARETDQETSRDIGSSTSNVTWEDLEDE